MVLKNLGKSLSFVEKLHTLIYSSLEKNLVNDWKLAHPNFGSNWKFFIRR